MINSQALTELNSSVFDPSARISRTRAGSRELSYNHHRNTCVSSSAFIRRKNPSQIRVMDRQSLALPKSYLYPDRGFAGVARPSRSVRDEQSAFLPWR